MEKEIDKLPQNSLQEATNQVYKSPTPNEIPIMVSSLYPLKNGLVPIEKDFEMASECGINAFFTSARINNIGDNDLHEKEKYDMLKTVFNYAAKYNLKILLTPDSVKPDEYNNTYLKDVQEVLDLKSKATGGWRLVDEMSYYNWHDEYGENNPIPGCKFTTSSHPYKFVDMVDLYNNLTNSYPEYMTSFNLVADTGKCYLGPIKTYSEYLNEIQDVFHPAVWMFDFYPVKTGSGDQSNPANWLVLYEDFYGYLIKFRLMSQKTNRPFWSYAISVSYEDISHDNKIWYPVPTEATLRWQVFSALAFGAKGIAYWYYAQRFNDGTSDVHAPIQCNPDTGVRTKSNIWYAMQKVNMEIKKFTEVFLDTKLQALYQLGGTTYDGIPIYQNKLVAVTKLTATGKGVLISHFTKGDVNYLMVTSKDVQGSVTFNTRFARNKYVMVLGWGGLLEHNVVTPLDAVSGDETEWKLDAGGYVIFKWDLGRPINEYVSPTPGRIPIITSSPYPISKEPTVADITGVAQCGFNTIVGNPKHISKLVECCRKSNTGIKIKVTQASYTNSQFLDIVRRHMYDPEIAGWSPNDQPYWYNFFPNVEVSACDISTLPPHYKWNLLELYDQIRAIDPGKMVYFNFACTTSPCYIGTLNNYKAYLEKINEIANPPVWSFDIYPVMGPDSAIRVNYADFYNYMKLFSDISIKSKRPFWYYCQSVSYKFKGNVHFPTPTENIIRWEVFTALAFGAKGIEYWYYAQRPDEPNWEYIISPLLETRQRTAIWNYVRNVNREIADLNDVFLDTELVGISTIGEPTYNIPVYKRASSDSAAKLESTGAGVMISHLKGWDADKKKTIHYYVIVSKDVLESVKLTTKFFRKNNVEAINGGGQGIISFQYVGASTDDYSPEIQWTLKPGGYVIFKWEE